jgi:hypothetical protein
MTPTLTSQSELELFAPEVSGREVEGLVAFLASRPGVWVTAAHYLAMMWTAEGSRLGARGSGAMPTEDNKRWVRALAEGSQGRICGGCKGYRLTTDLTQEEYDGWRGSWLRSASAIQERVAKADRMRLTTKQPSNEERLEPAPKMETAEI